MLGGGPSYFGALWERAHERAELGYDTTELMAQLLEVSFASYRCLLVLTGAKHVPDQIKVRRPGQKRKAVNWRTLAARLGGERRG